MAHIFSPHEFPGRLVLGVAVVLWGDLGAGTLAARPDPTAEPLEEALSLDALLALGLNGEAERVLRADLAAGLTDRRAPFLRLLLNERRAGEATDLLARWGSAVPGEGVLFLAARIHEQTEDWTKAAEAYELSAGHEPVLADHAAYRAGLAWEQADHTDEALAAFETAGASARGQGLSARAYWSAARLAADSGEPERALENLERIPARSVIARKDLLDLEVRIYREQGERERELRALRETLDRVPSSEEAIAAIRRIEDLEPPTVQDRIAFAQTALQNRHGTLAEEQAKLALAQLGTDKTVDPTLEGAARLALGKGLILQRQLTRARDELERLPPEAAPEDRAEASLDRARCLWRLGQIDACLAEYDLVADGDAPAEYRGTAAWEAGREAKDNRRWAEAAIRLAEFQRSYPDHDYADDAAWHGGRAAAEVGRIDEALALFALLQQRYPDSPYLEEAGYWRASLQRERGDSDAACAEVAALLSEHPDSYWTQRARETFGDSGCAADTMRSTAPIEDLHAWFRTRFPDQEPGAGELTAETIRSSPPFRRGRLLASMGLLADAEDELDGLRRSLERDPATLLAFAESAWEAGVSRSGMRAITILRARAGLPILSGETPVRVARLLYPIDHLDSVLRWSSEYDLDPLFVYAVMREESWFDPAAESWVGARGLLQIMPSTGRDLARRVGLPDFDRSDLFNPDVNIRLGAFYLSVLLQELNKEPAVALSAYNAGKNNALRWRDNAKGVGEDARTGVFDVDRYVAGITYRETYNYVQKVTRSWAIYRHLYGDLVPQLERLHEADADAR